MKNKYLKIIVNVIFIICISCAIALNKAYALENYSEPISIQVVIGEEIKEVDSIKDAISEITTSDKAIIKLPKNTMIDSKITIPANRNITLQGIQEKSIITRGKTISGTKYLGQLFSVTAGSTLKLENIILDNENEWVIDEELYFDALNNGKRISDKMAFITPEEGAPICNAWMFNNSGIIETNNVEIINYYNGSGSGIFNGTAGSSLTISNTIIKHCAVPTNGSLVTYIQGVNTKVFIEKGTIIDDNYCGGNGGLLKVYNGAVMTMNGGEIKNTKALNTNGVVSMLYGAGSTFILNDGLIASNSGVYGANNGRNSAIYIHRDGSFIMNGGIIEKNQGYSCGGIDCVGYTNSKVEFNGGIIRNNVVINPFSDKTDVNLPADYNITIGEDMTIVGNMYVAGGVVNNGKIEGLLSINIKNVPEDEPLSGSGTISGDVIVYHSEETTQPDTNENDMVDGYVVYCGPNQVVLTTFYKENVDNNKRKYNMTAVDVTTADVPQRVQPVKEGYTFLGWYEDEELTEPWDEKDEFSSKKELFASWKINQYTITWILGDEEVKEKVTYNEKIKLPEQPSKNGHNFAGWDGYYDGMTMPAKDITISAKWNANASSGTAQNIATSKKKKYKKKVVNEIEENVIEEEIVEEKDEIIENTDKNDFDGSNDLKETNKKTKKSYCWIFWWWILILILILIYRKYKKEKEKRELQRNSNRISKHK